MIFNCCGLPTAPSMVITTKQLIDCIIMNCVSFKISSRIIPLDGGFLCSFGGQPINEQNYVYKKTSLQQRKRYIKKK